MYYGMVESFTLTVEQRSICGFLHLPSNSHPPCVITCHGLFSSKDTEKFISIASNFTQRGIAVIRFDFGGCGESSGSSIAETTVSGRLKELAAVVQFVKQYPLLGPTFGLLGSSLGGFVSLLYAARDPAVAALSLWATPCSLNGLRTSIPEEQADLLRENFFLDAQHYNLAPLLPEIGRVLIIHGENDSIVPYTHAEEIFRQAAVPKELRSITGGDHSLTAREAREKAITLSYRWFERYLKKNS